MNIQGGHLGGGDTTSKNEKKIWYNNFLSGAFERGLDLKFAHPCERFSCLFFRRGCLRSRQCLQTLFIAWLKQYKVSLLMINSRFLVTTFCRSTTTRYAVTSIVENVPLVAAYTSLLDESTISEQNASRCRFSVSRTPPQSFASSV